MNVKTKHQCPVCKATHDSRGVAEDCCPRSVEEVFVCGECGAWFDEYDKARAEACCEKKVVERLREEERLRAARRCLCGELLSNEDARDSKHLGTLAMCRSCILSVAPEMQTAEQIARAAA